MSEHDLILPGDARVVLPSTLVPDVLICDPPYRAHVHDNATSQDQHTDGNVRHNDFGFASLTEELRTWICQLAAKTRRWSLIYTDVESVAKWKDTLELAGATYIRTLPWVRWSMPALSGDRPPQGFECIVVAYGSNRGRKRWNGAGNLVRLAHPLDWSGPDELLEHLANGDWDDLTHIAHLALRGNGKHKTEKPLDQALDLVSWFSDPGELVVDPCSGSGTVGLACKILGRKFLGCELDAEWAGKGNARVQSCDPSNLPGSLSARDSERFLRWVTTSEKEKSDLVERKYNTERVRKRMADKKMASGTPGSVTSIEVVAPGSYYVNGKIMELKAGDRVPFETEPVEQREEAVNDAWTEAYQRCVAELAPPLSPALRAKLAERKTPAADRTLSLFEDEYVAKDWREAYERSVAELDEIPVPTWADPQATPKRVASGEAIPDPYKYLPGGEPKHYDTGNGCLVTTTIPPQNGEAAKRGKGRPPGARNKAPKAWKEAMARAVAELGVA